MLAFSVVCFEIACTLTNEDNMNAIPLSVAEQYLRYCDNVMRDDQIVSDEYSLLLSNPNIQGISFYSPTVLVIGTTLVSIPSPQHEDYVHDIGEFLIFILREREGRRWSTDFCFVNVTGSLYDDTAFLHPHIVAADPKYESVKPPIGEIGRLCIQQGQFHLFQHIRDGKMHLAADMLIDILHTYGTGRPFVELHQWPGRAL